MKSKYMVHQWGVVVLLAMLIQGCEKIGPEGPQGPEGPAGNDGTGGGGGSAVISYSTTGSGIDFFRWMATDVSNRLVTRYELFAVQGDNVHKRLEFRDTTGTADNAIAVVYVQFIDSDGGETWTGLPYEQLGGSLGTRYHVDDVAISPGPSGDKTVKVSVVIGATQFNDLRWNPQPPELEVGNVRVLFIPAGSVGEIGAISTSKLNTLPMQYVIDRLSK